jgi:WD40 repeat protein
MDPPLALAAQLQGHTGCVNCAHWHPTDPRSLLATGSDDQTIRVWDVSRAARRDVAQNEIEGTWETKNKNKTKQNKKT